ncbi:hypothetical protein GOP47_0021621 [Adiantum capillus-veneris]|uniref:Lipoxygenase domain-containing protein n=1 Tax=Adiantum capillus-veneris TaxID=13818 RepID=A0A9D4U9L6_ADICA|nr:hypothetical protein GOP47_0021621 [Adiantum capillus-veneris]
MESLSLIQGKVEIAKEGLVDSISHSVATALGFKINLQLVSLTVDPATATGQRSAIQNLKIGTRLPSFLTTPAQKINKDSYLFPLCFSVAQDFATPGAILLDSEFELEFFLESIRLQLPGLRSEILFPAKFWINQSKLYAGSRILFADEAYLPCDTPKGLEKLRREELAYLKGNDTGARKTGERIYSYDLYNNLGNPDSSADLARPVLGGSKDLPYPRRCRTGSKHTEADPKSEPSESTYLPRDEVFTTQKNNAITSKGIVATIHGLQTLIGGEKPFKSLEEVYGLYAGNLDPSLSSKYSQSDGTLFKFPPPIVAQANKQAWMSDEEFAHQRLAGMNPNMIRRLKEFPPKSTLNTDVHGREKCTITENHLEGRLEGLTVQQALDEKRLYILDYHDSFITPYVAKINEGEGKVYASRTLFFLTKAGVLIPIVIELLLPPKLRPSDNASWTNRVFPSPMSGKTDWLWQLAKGHVALVDTCHQHLCSHWIKTHAGMEPFIIATRRNLSAIHPAAKFLSPHFKDTMGTNQAARAAFLNGGGCIEKSFVTGKYSNEVSSIDYKQWRFDEQALPKDLLARGMAELDKKAEHGLKLYIEDYPYANDGLNLWAALEKWVTEYTDIYYQDDKAVEKDEELQAWWTEVREVRHGDHKDAKWWAKLVTKSALIETILTILWVATGLHGVAGFGQYPFAGLMPNCPTMGRRLIPEEGSAEYKELMGNPETFFLSSFSTRTEAASTMETFEITSQHLGEEAYLGGDGDDPPSSNARVVAAHQRFRASIAALHDIILARTTNPTPHRAGPSQMPFSLLLPYSPPGLTGRGLVKSISI